MKTTTRRIAAINGIRLVEDTKPDTLSNANVWVEYRRNDKQIFARDLKDMNNEPACYTKGKRGLDKVWDALVKVFATQGNSVTHHTVMTTFSSMGMPYHYWCMMD
jgi:hypothetical protein